MVKSSAVAPLVLVALFGTCARASAGHWSGSRGAPALLSYITESGKIHHWILWNADSRQKETFLDLREAPKFVFWDTQEMRVYYTIGSRILSSVYPQRRAAPSYVATLPPGDLQVMWVEQTSGRLRVAVEEEIPDNAITENADGTSTYRTHDGSNVEGSDFPWGAPAVYTALELGSSGRWTTIASRGSKTDADETPDARVLDDFHHERGASQDTLLKSYSCESGKTDWGYVPKYLISDLAKAGFSSPDDFRYTPEGNGAPGLVTRIGDFYLVECELPGFIVPGTGQLTRINLPSRDTAIGIARNRQYLLISDEGSGDDPAVIDVKTGIAIMSERGTAAVWLPLPNAKPTAPLKP